MTAWNLSRVNQEIDGLVSEYDTETLFAAAQRLPKKAVVVEIGTYKGKSTICLALGLMSAGNEDARIYSFDVIQDPDARQSAEKAGVGKYITFIQAASPPPAEKWSREEPIDLLFVDGNHEPPYTENDLKYWLPKLRWGGTLIMDDWRCKGVKQAYHNQVFKSNEYYGLEIKNDLATATKRPYGDPIAKRIQYRLSVNRETTQLAIDWVGGRLKHVLWGLGLNRDTCPYDGKPLIERAQGSSRKAHACPTKHCTFNRGTA